MRFAIFFEITSIISSCYFLVIITLYPAAYILTTGVTPHKGGAVVGLRYICLHMISWSVKTISIVDRLFYIPHVLAVACSPSWLSYGQDGSLREAYPPNSFPWLERSTRMPGQSWVVFALTPVETQQSAFGVGLMAINYKSKLFHPGVLAALGAALLFGSGTPLAKLLLSSINPWLLAGLLYVGSGVGLSLYRLVRRAPAGKLLAGEWPWLTGAIFSGGVVGPVLLMFGLAGMPASGASLLLNGEGVFTALLAWFAFHENFDRRIAWGMVAILGGAVLLSWPGEAKFSSILPALAILGACLAWGIDNNLTRKVSLADATWIAALKGLAAGSVNLALAFLLGASLPSLPVFFSAMVLGCLTYGVSLALFVVGLRHLGTARTGAYFSVAPFFGAILSIPLLGEQISLKLMAAGSLMGLGVWLHLTERHRHEHGHVALDHEHEHVHDDHHQHEHRNTVTDKKHCHPHHHEPLVHEHEHFPDVHHGHGH